jgi:PAS domain S-box-containing protein
MREREFFDTLCNTADGVFIVDADKRVVRWNKGAEKILKYPEIEVLNRDCYRVIAGRTLPEKVHCHSNCKVHNNASKGIPSKNFELLTHTNVGEPVWLNVSVISSISKDEFFLAHIVRDITREKRTGLVVDQFLADLGVRSLARKEPVEHKPAAIDPAPNRNPEHDKSAAALSSREIEVLTLLAEGLSTKALAQKLDISHFTARNHIQNILVKLDLHSKAQAVSYAFKRGYL